MLGLMVMLVALIYFVILFSATIGCYLLLQKFKKTQQISTLLSFLVEFVHFFLNYYPTKWANDYYCKNETCFFQYRTIEQWKSVNPSILKTLWHY